jgi:hypothetical protein
MLRHRNIRAEDSADAAGKWISHDHPLIYASGLDRQYTLTDCSVA